MIKTINMIKILPEPLQGAVHNYAFIDRVFYDELADQLPVLEMVVPPLKAQANLYPYLLPLSQLTDEQWQNLNRQIAIQIDNAEPPICSVFFTSRCQPEYLCQLLAEHMLKRFNNQNFVLRYYDPKVMIQLLWIYLADEWHNFAYFKGISDWSFYLNHQWYSLQFSPQLAPYIKFDKEEQLCRLKRIGLVNKILAKYTQLPSDLLDYIEWSRSIDKALAKCEVQYSFTQESEKIMFVEHSLQYGEEFDQSKIMQPLFKQLKQNTASYSILISQLTEQQWQQLSLASTEIRHVY